MATLSPIFRYKTTKTLKIYTFFHEKDISVFNLGGDVATSCPGSLLYALTGGGDPSECCSCGSREPLIYPLGGLVVWYLLTQTKTTLQIPQIK